MCYNKLSHFPSVESIFIFIAILIPKAKAENSNLFTEYIGAEFNGVKFSDVPINPNVRFHFLLAFAIDYTSSSNPNPTHTNGKFNVFWDSDNLSPSEVSSIKRNHPNVRVGLSLGGDSVGHKKVHFQSPSGVDLWVANAVDSLRTIIQQYELDGIDIDYEHFNADPETFAECIGELISTLKQNGLVKFVSIAPFDDEEVQSHYLALWKRYGHLINHVNFQFYAYDESTTVGQFIGYFEKQTENYEGGRILASFSSKDPGGLQPGKGFFKACEELKERNQLYGIFVWCADDSKTLGLGFRHENRAQELLAS